MKVMYIRETNESRGLEKYDKYAVIATSPTQYKIINGEGYVIKVDKNLFITDEELDKILLNHEVKIFLDYAKEMER